MITRIVLLCATVGALFTLALSPSLALSESQQDAAITALQSAVNTLQSQVKSLQTDNTTLKSNVSTLQSQVKTLQTTVGTQGTTLTTQATQIAALQKKTNGFYVSTDTTRTDGKKYTEMYFKGLNLHIIDGSGYTDDGTQGEKSGAKSLGLGNIIIGYNGTRTNTGYGPDARTGSHNLVLGDLNNYTSFGGIVDGQVNTISALYASVVGGNGNVASGSFACVSGGLYGTASGASSSVTGGNQNAASGDYSSITGGLNNKASGNAASITGGQFNTVSGYVASITGGQLNTAAGAASSVSGGSTNTTGDPANPGTPANPYTPGVLTSISGGNERTLSASYGWMAGSEGATAVSGNFSSP